MSGYPPRCDVMGRRICSSSRWSFSKSWRPWRRGPRSYHGVLAPRARWRPDVVAYRRTECGWARDPRAAGEGASGPRYWTWALLMRRAFDLAVLRGPRCAGRMQL